MNGRLIILILLFTLPNNYILNAQVNFESLREEMVREQMIDRGIIKPTVIKALRKVKRHLFVPEEVRSLAYNDYPLMIGEGQTISQPYIVALMTELLIVDKDSKVLEIGTGSGYQAAVLGEIVRDVYTVEIVEPLYIRSRKLLDSLDYRNIHCKLGDGYKGWEEHAPYDAIIVTCAPTEIPEALINQLSENGRMIIPVGERFTQNLVVLRKRNGKIRKQTVAPVIFVPMVKESKERYQ